MTKNISAESTFPELGDICKVQGFRCYTLDVSFYLRGVDYNALGQYHRHARNGATAVGIDSSSF
jgi:hypothetical protein